MKQRNILASWRTRQKKIPRQGNKIKQNKRLKMNEKGLRKLQDNMKQNNIHIIGRPEGEEEETGIENMFEKVMTENFPTLMREKVMQIHEAQRVPIKMNPQRPTQKHIIIKIAKFTCKERILKATREKQLVTYKGALIRLSAS